MTAQSERAHERELYHQRIAKMTPDQLTEYRTKQQQSNQRSKQKHKDDDVECLTRPTAYRVKSMAQRFIDVMAHADTPEPSGIALTTLSSTLCGEFSVVF
jgi:hypothetical protein